ncbi:DUF2957 domain-containing protein [Trinickia acidisoli]|uniref:DUF2957 domain-containing protein n=1 Tax=Trinickia acidisoli TaxID=2767482 RepID=UPI001A8E99AC|nr:DUF2957 domain-containing protein [Trinickia acidisoli]
MIRNALLTAALVAPFLAACGSGGDSGALDAAAAVNRLCPASLDYSTVFTGGGGDGELAKMQIDTTKMTWQVTYVESAIPATTGTVTPSRAGTTQSGTLAPETLLPTQAQNECAFYLHGASLDPNEPARIFVGQGVLGGTIPGKEIQYSGIAGFGAVPDKTFPYFPFIGFSSLETNLANVAGTYNQIGYHIIPSQNYATVAVDATIAIHADGTWTETDNVGVNEGKTQQAGTDWVQSSDGSGAFETDNFQSQAKPTSSITPEGKGFMIVGKLRNQLVPILIRTGYANPLTLEADDESGISILAPQTSIAVDTQDGQYIGVDSQFDYRATALEGNEATLLAPYQPANASLATPLDLSFANAVPGVVTSSVNGVSSTAATGKLVFTGGVFGYLYNENSSPYFMINAFVQ